jgi:drug/metabolite transporter (DMT)-like permease
MLATTLISSIFAVSDWMHPSYEQLIFITLASLVTIIGGVASAKAFLCDSPNKLAALQFLTVPFSFVFGLIFWGEQVSAQFVMGAAIVIIFSYLSVKNHKVQSTIGVQD